MAKQNERTVVFYDGKLWCSAGPIKGIAPKPMRELLQLIAQLHAGTIDMDRHSDDEAETTYLCDIEVGNAYATLLIGVSDRDAADPAFTDRRLRRRRVVRKKDGEGVDCTAHIVVRLTPNDSDPDAYTVLVERMNGVGSGRVITYINFLIRKVQEEYEGMFETEHPSGTVDPKTKDIRTVKGKHRLELRGHPSDEFLADLRAGRLLSIDLITESTKTEAWDQDGYAREKYKVVKIAPANEKIQHDPLAALRSICGLADKRGYERARVVFKNHNDVERTAEIETKTMDIISDAYVKKVQISGFDQPLNESHPAIIQGVVKKMRALLRTPTDA